MSRRNVLICFCLLLVLASSEDCRTAEKFPGFTQVESDSGKLYLVDLSTIKRLGGLSQFQFTQIISSSDGSYDVGEVVVDCETRIAVAGESSHYDRNKRYGGTVPLHAQTIAKIPDFVCREGEKAVLISGSFDRDIAIQRVLGGSRTEWTVPLGVNSKVLNGRITDFLGKTLKVSVLTDYPYREGDKPKQLLVLGSYPADGSYGCHACGVLMSAFTFRQEGQGWLLEAHDPYLGIEGSFSVPPTISPLKIGPDHLGFTASSSFMAQGVESETVALFAPQGARVLSLITIEKKWDATAGIFGIPDAKFKTEYTLGPSQIGGFYELHLKTSGKKMNGNLQLVSSDQTLLCRVNGAKYDCQPN